jgi:FemAB-related protein (PEP-CTERM system-associated)
VSNKASEAPLTVMDVATPVDAAAWDSAIGRLPGGSFYHRHAWKNINRDALGHKSIYLMARRDDRVVGVLPLTLVSSRLFGTILCSLPFVNYGGPCVESEDVAISLLEHAKDWARKENVHALEFRCSEPFKVGVEPSLRKVSRVLQLDRNPEKLWVNFTSKHRKNVKRAERNPLEVESGHRNLMAEFYTVMECAWRDLGTPFYARGYFEKILESFPDETRIFICRHGDKPVAAALVGYFAGTVEGLWNGSTSAARVLSANYVLYWRMIQDACERGFATFHLGRSTSDSGAEEFKSRWNAERRQLFWYSWNPEGRTTSQISVDNPKYSLAIKIWKRLPLKLTRVIGPGLARCIP